MPSLPSSQQPDSPPKRHSGRPRPQTKVQFHQPTRPPAQRLASRSQGTKATCRPTFSDRRFRFPQNGARLLQSRPTVILSSPVPSLCRGETRTRVVSSPGIDGETCGSGALIDSRPPPLSLPPGEKPTLQRQRWHSGWIRLSLKSWRTPAAQPGAEGPPVQLNMGKPPLSHQVTRPNSPTCPLAIDDTNHTATRSRGSAERAVCPSM